MGLAQHDQGCRVGLVPTDSNPGNVDSTPELLSPLSLPPETPIFWFLLTVTQFLWPTGRSTALQESIGKIFQGVVEIGLVAEGLELPSTGCWSSLPPSWASLGPFLGLLLRPGVLYNVRCLSGPPVSCPTPLCAPEEAEGPFQSLPSCSQKAGGGYSIPEETTAGRKPRVPGASSLPAASHSTPDPHRPGSESLGLRGSRNVYEAPTWEGDAVHHLCPCHRRQVTPPVSAVPLEVEANLRLHSALLPCATLCVYVCVFGMYKLLCCRRDLIYSPDFYQEPKQAV